MVERFSPDSRGVLRAAGAEAREFAHDYVGSEHVLLGLLSGENPSARALRSMGLSIDTLRDDVASLVGRGPGSPEKLAFTPRVLRIFEFALREALARGHKEIEPAHLLLGVVDEREGVALEILARRRLAPSRVRADV